MDTDVLLAYETPKVTVIKVFLRTKVCKKLYGFCSYDGNTNHCVL